MNLIIQDWIIKSRLYGLLDLMYPYPQTAEMTVSGLSRLIEIVEVNEESESNGRKKLNLNMHPDRLKNLQLTQN